MSKGKLIEEYESYEGCIVSNDEPYMPEFMELLKQAKKSFPKPIITDLIPGVEIKHYYTSEVEEWFKNWFGDSD